MAAFCRLSCNWNNDESVINEITSQLPGTNISLPDLNEQFPQVHGFTICKFAGGDLIHTTEPKEELHVNFNHNQLECVVVFRNKLAQIIQKLILNNRLSVGDFVSLECPTIICTLDGEKMQNITSLLIMDNIEKQRIIIWKNSNMYFAEPFLTHLKQYNHIQFHTVDYTGSTSHALTDLCNLMEAYGPIKPLRLIAGSHGDSVAVASFRKIMHSHTKHVLSKDPYDPEKVFVQVKFSELLLQVKEVTLTTFTTFFIGPLAIELEKAVSEGHMKRGDLVGLICPRFNKKTAAPINIHFPPKKGVNLIVLKKHQLCRHVSSKLCPNDINLIFGTVDESRGNEKEYLPLTFSSLKNCLNEENVISSIHKRLLKHHQITPVTKLSSSKQSDITTIMCFFLRIKETISSMADKTIVFVREISPDCTYGHYSKVVLQNSFSKAFYSAVKDKMIVQGDVVCLVNPVIFENPKNESSCLEIDVPHVIEVGNPDEQTIVLFRLKQNENNTQSSISLIDKKNNNDEMLQSIEKYSNLSKNNNVVQSYSPNQTGIVSESCITKINNNKKVEKLLRKSTNKDCNLLCTNKIIESKTENNKALINDTMRTASSSHTAIHKSTLIESNTLNNETDPTTLKRVSNPSNHILCRNGAIESKTVSTKADTRSSKRAATTLNSLPCKKRAIESISDNQKLFTAVNSELCKNKVVEIKMTTKPSKPSFEQNSLNHVSQPTAKNSGTLLPVVLTKPKLEHIMDLISGYCRNCRRMIQYSIICFVNNNSKLLPLCPKCIRVLKLSFCLEMKAETKEGHFKIILLHGVEAEKFLNTSLKEFLTYNSEYKENIVRNLKIKLSCNQKGNGVWISPKDITYTI